MASEKIQYLTDETFQKLVSSSEQPVFVDFWATWCGPCRALAPVFEQLAESPAYDGKIIFAKVDVDQCQETAQKMRVMSIPTLVLFKDGNVVEKLVGLRGEEELRSVLDRYLS